MDSHYTLPLSRRRDASLQSARTPVGYSLKQETYLSDAVRHRGTLRYATEINHCIFCNNINVFKTHLPDATRDLFNIGLAKLITLFKKINEIKNNTYEFYLILMQFPSKYFLFFAIVFIL